VQSVQTAPVQTTVQRATSCLVKSYLSDGTVQFQDTCTGESSQ
jgi:hypothetical protein